MKLHRCTEGFIVIFIILLFTAAYFDEPGLLFISSSLGLFITSRYWIFLFRIKKIADSCTINRKLEKKVFRQGNLLKVNTEISITSETGINIQYSENPVAGIIFNHGEISKNISENAIQTCNLIYWIIPIIHGNIRFAYGELLFSDLFFSSTLHLSKNNYTNPEIRIVPVPFFEKETILSTRGDKENEKANILQGFSIRSYREYIPGDDIRKIDWKLTAKYDNLYVREYSGMQNKPPLIIADLPEQGTSYKPEGLQSIIRAITGIIENKNYLKENLSILVISGPNIISMVLDEYDHAKCMELVTRYLHPQIRNHHLYRVKKRSDIREELKQIRDQKKENFSINDNNFFERKSTIYLKVLMEKENTHFSNQISKILTMHNPEEIVFYSLCEGDVSHIQEILKQSHYRNIRFTLKIPSKNYPEFMKKAGIYLKGEKIEMIQ
ncbi:DUF58 domain-containing protein [Methanospirillum stamsii]|uniref:DUF58 domain-containing protein n=1 Tax=Methanospirillum stamsii TaxID=1277351 RepID=UPI0015E843E0|nr:DUF58 domain-containing protein [Methanospirillum stamsii]